MVRLTGGDLGRLMRREGLGTVEELRARGWVSWVREPVGGGHFAWRPRIRFRTRPLVQCPFLVNDMGPDGYRGLCSLHPQDKPLVCRLSPLTREVEDRGSDWTERWGFVPPVEGCPGVGKGGELPLRAPAGAEVDLEDEVRWMRFLIAESPFCPDEGAAWGLLRRWRSA